MVRVRRPGRTELLASAQAYLEWSGALDENEADDSSEKGEDKPEQLTVFRALGRLAVRIDLFQRRARHIQHKVVQSVDYALARHTLMREWHQRGRGEGAMTLDEFARSLKQEIEQAVYGKIPFHHPVPRPQLDQLDKAMKSGDFQRAQALYAQLADSAALRGSLDRELSTILDDDAGRTD